MKRYRICKIDRVKWRSRYVTRNPIKIRGWSAWRYDLSETRRGSSISRVARHRLDVGLDRLIRHRPKLVWL